MGSGTEKDLVGRLCETWEGLSAHIMLTMRERENGENAEPVVSRVDMSKRGCRREFDDRESLMTKRRAENV